MFILKYLPTVDNLLSYSSLSQSFEFRSGLATRMKYFGTGMHRCTISRLCTTDIYIYICMYIYIYVCMYVCMYVNLKIITIFNNSSFFLIIFSLTVPNTLFFSLTKYLISSPLLYLGISSFFFFLNFFL